MPKPHTKQDDSTVCERVLKEWSDHYPPEKVSALQAKAQSIGYAITETKLKLDKLVCAQKRLSSLSEPLGATIPTLTKALAAYTEFTAEYGDLGVSPSIPITDMQKTISEYVASLAAYMVDVHKAYFSNLDSVKMTIGQLTSLRDLYENLAQIAVTIRKEYFPTEESRRKPIVRELCRRFKALENVGFFGMSPDIENPLLSERISREEFVSLSKVWKEAKATEQVLRTYR